MRFMILVVAMAAGCIDDGSAVGDESGTTEDPACSPTAIDHGVTEVPPSAFCVTYGDARFTNGVWLSTSDVVQLQATVHSAGARTASVVRLRFSDAPTHGGYTVLLRGAQGADEFAYGFVNTDATPAARSQLDATVKLPHAIGDATVIVQLTTNAPYGASLLGVDITTD